MRTKCESDWQRKWNDDGRYSKTSHPGLFVFFQHSDCDGEISPEDCKTLAAELETLLPKLEEMGLGAGHIQRDGGYGAVARKFIAGCLAAAAQNEPLEFR